MPRPHTKSPFVLLILLLLGAFLIFSLWAARQAATRGSRVSDPDYYSKGLRYNNTRVEETAALSQGWQLMTTIDNHRLIFQLTDTSGSPIDQASGDLTLFLSRQNQVLHMKTSEILPGKYLIELPEDALGSMQARIEFVRLGTRLSRQLLVNL